MARFEVSDDAPFGFRVADDEGRPLYGDSGVPQAEAEFAAMLLNEGALGQIPDSELEMALSAAMVKRYCSKCLQVRFDIQIADSGICGECQS